MYLSLGIKFFAQVPYLKLGVFFCDEIEIRFGVPFVHQRRNLTEIFHYLLYLYSIIISFKFFRNLNNNFHFCVQILRSEKFWVAKFRRPTKNFRNQFSKIYGNLLDFWPLSAVYQNLINF